MSELRVLTYNVKFLPPVVKGVLSLLRWLGGREGPASPLSDRERAEAIATAVLAGGWDVVCLQEVFDESCRKVLRQELEGAGYQVVAKVHDYDPLNDDSGLFLASKLPITLYRYEEFDDKGGADALADKGILGACLAAPGTWKARPHQLFVFVTHLQSSGDTIRVGQLRQARRFIRDMLGAVPDPSVVAAVLLGDLNVRAEDAGGAGQVLVPTAEYANMLALLDGPRDLFREVGGEDPGYTWDPVGNAAMTGPQTELVGSRIDYALALNAVAHEDGRDPRQLGWLHCTGASVETFRSGPASLSDHYGVSVTLTVEGVEEA